MRPQNLIPILIGLTLFTAGCTTADDDMPDVVVPPAVEWSEAEVINHWIYDQMNYHYLWREDLPDSLSCDYTLTPKEFFESLLSEKDRFSYMGQKSGRSETAQSVGFAYQPCRDSKGEVYLQVLYVTSANAVSAGLRRGDLVKILEQDGGKVRLEKISFEDNSASGQLLSYSMETRAKVNETVQLDSIYDIAGKRIGYLCYLEYDAATDFYEAFSKFKNVDIDELVLDLRYNPGGLVTTCKRLCNMIVSENAYGEMFQQSSYNDIISRDNLIRYGNERTFSYFDTPTVKGPTLGPKWDCLNLKRLYVITSKNTASSSEATINSLRPYMDVVVIGENTVGKGVGMYTLSSSKFKYALVPITFRFYNAEGETIPDTGIVPDYYVEDGNLTPKRDLGDLEEPLLAKAIELITSVPPPIESRRKVQEVKGPVLIPVGEPSYVTEFNRKYHNGIPEEASEAGL